MIFPSALYVGNHTQRSAFSAWLRGLAPPQPPSPCEVTAAKIFYRTLNMKIERFAGHHEAREALVLAVVGVTAIMLIESLILLILF